MRDELYKATGISLKFLKTKNGLTLLKIYAVSKGLLPNIILTTTLIKAQQKPNLLFDNKIEVQ